MQSLLYRRQSGQSCPLFKFSDPQFSTSSLVSVRPQTPYVVEVNLPDFGRDTQTVVSPASGIMTLPVFNLARKANVTGSVVFPDPIASPYGGEWVSVEALPAGSNFPTAWGGVYLNNGQTSGSYTVYGVSPGSFTLRASVRGFMSSTTSVTVANSDLSGINFPLFSTGGKITGSLTVVGSSFGLPRGSCGSGFFAVNLNASSRATFANAFSQVCLPLSETSSSGSYTISGLPEGTYQLFSYLPGFEVSPPGPLQVTVSGGTGTKEIILNALTGHVDIQAALPAGDDGALVSYRLIKSFSSEGERTGALTGSPTATGSVGHLGTGLYRLILQNGNPGRGLVQESVLTATNGSGTSVSVDLTLPSYSISGDLTVQGSLVLPSPWSVTVSSVPGLVAAGVLPTVDVYALPLPDHFDNNTQPLRSVSAQVFESSAGYRVEGLSPGGYLLRVREDLNPPPCCENPALSELAGTAQSVYVGTSSLADLDLRLTNGAKVTGTLSRPPNDPSTDPRFFNLILRREDNLAVWVSSVATGLDGRASYAFGHLSPGRYALEAKETGASLRYSASPVSLELENADSVADIALLDAGTLVGRLRDADSQTLLTAANADQFLPDNFEIAAQADPWVAGGYIQAARQSNGPGFAFDPDTGQFRISRLLPDRNYNLHLRGFTSFDNAALARGVRTYTPIQISGIQVAAGQTVDVGTLDLKQGGQLSGTLRDNAGSPRANIRVIARPALKNGDRGDLQVEAFSKEDGGYELYGLDRDQRYYDVIAAPRFRAGETYAKLSGPRYAEERLRMIDVTDPAQLTGQDFTLTLANGVLVGQVKTVDNGILTPALTDDKSATGERGANVVLHRDGAVLSDNPMGEIEERTAPDGTFRVEGLEPGLYTVRVLALGYASALKSVGVPAGTAEIGEIVLTRGASVAGSITFPDGSFPSQDDVRMILAVDDNFEEFVFGTVSRQPDTLEVTGYSISGLRPQVSYSLVGVTGKEDILEMHTGLIFTNTNEERVLPLVFRPAPPQVFVNRVHSVTDTARVTALKFFSSQPLRNVTADDNDPAAWLRLVAGVGTLSGVQLNSSRETITAVYTAPLTEESFSLRLSFYTTSPNPDDVNGGPFLFVDTFTFHAGISTGRSANISNVIGGDCTLEGIPTGIVFEPGAFDLATSSTVEVNVLSADALSSLPPSCPRLSRSAAVQRAAQTWGPAAYPSASLSRAVRAASTLNPFSAFYDVLLPAGLNHLLKKDALLTLQYDQSVEDPSRLNLYYYDPAHGAYFLEKSQRTIDPINHTLTVSVGHLSTFVVLPSQAAVIGNNSFTGQDVEVHNVPNPFSLRSKSVSLANVNGADSSQTIEGTFIRYCLPPGKSGEVKIEIYDVSGARVRTLTQTAPAGGTSYYLEWNGRNDAGEPVASGVYLAHWTLNGGDQKTFKMAVLK